MKIVFTGGGSGGHFYPIIAIAESIKKIVKEKKLIEPEMYFFSPDPYNQGILYDNNIKYKKVLAGKIRRYFSIKNFFDLFKTFHGVIKALFDLFDIFPDVIFSKGGFGSFPVVLAGRILQIPVFIHESDSKPGRANAWAGKFAKRIAVSYKEATVYFKHKDRLLHTGQPIMEEKRQTISENCHEFFSFDKGIKTIFVVGGSQGAEIINNIILDSIQDLIKDYQVIHQTGPKNIEIVKEASNAILLDNKFRERYKPYGYLNSLEMRMAGGASDIVISRAGSTIFEISSWGKPSIIIPINSEVSHDQVSNAFAYKKTGSCSVIEEENLKQHIFISEIKKILENENIKKEMSEKAKEFFKSDASSVIAKEILSIIISHEELV